MHALNCRVMFAIPLMLNSAELSVNLPSASVTPLFAAAVVKLLVPKKSSIDLYTALPMVAWPDVQDGNGGVKSSLVLFGSPPGAPSGRQFTSPTVFGLPSSKPEPSLPASWMALTGRQ